MIKLKEKVQTATNNIPDTKLDPSISVTPVAKPGDNQKEITRGTPGMTR